MDSKPRQNENDLSDESNDNMIKSMDKFDFWQNIEKEITQAALIGKISISILPALRKMAKFFYPASKRARFCEKFRFKGKY